MAGDEKEEPTLAERFTKQIEQIKLTLIETFDFTKWSPEEKTIVAKRWLFYIVYYIFIAGLFFLFIYSFDAGARSGSDDIRPLLHGRGLQSPGLNYVPILRNENADHLSYIKSVHKEIGTNVAFIYKSGKGNIYINAMKEFLKTEGREWSEYGDFGECNEDNDFGFKDDMPCLFFRLNKVSDWEPKGLEHGDLDKFFSKEDSNLFSARSYCSEERFGEYCRSKDGEARQQEIIDEVYGQSSAWNHTRPFIKCLLSVGSLTLPMKTIPENGELPWEEAFSGRNAADDRVGNSIFGRRDPAQVRKNSYLTPMVAVQFNFTEPKTKDKNALIHCFAFDRNIEVDPKHMASGMVQFYARVNS